MIRYPRCRVTFTVVLPLRNSPGNRGYRNRLKQLIANDCHRGKHQPECFIDVTNWNRDSGGFVSNASGNSTGVWQWNHEKSPTTTIGIIKPEETHMDSDGLMRIPSEGEILVRPDGKQWKVVEIIAQYRKGIRLPTYLVYLTESI